jgi:retron-type reverse transcriptase
VIQWGILELYIKKPLVNQHAYTKGLSTETAVSQVVDIIEGAVLNKQKCLAVSLDCSGAFDKIKFTSAVEAMKAFGIPVCIQIWYDFMLRNRLITADIQGVKKTIKPAMGSPQGGVLSPFIWNMIIDSLLSKFTASNPIHAVGYADDVILLIKDLTAR